MRIRNKLLLASSFSILLLVVQIVVVNLAIRELQSAVDFISSAQSTIEADFAAVGEVGTLRDQVKRMPSVYSGASKVALDIRRSREQLRVHISLIEKLAASESVGISRVGDVFDASEQVNIELDQTLNMLDDQSADLDMLIERAIFTNAALEVLRVALDSLAIELRIELQLAVDREREIHNLPVIAGIVLGSMAVILSLFLIWVFVDKAISRRLTALSTSMSLIAKGDLETEVPVSHSSDEISEMNTALAIFRKNAEEIRENNLRESALARRQNQYWLENMASFLRHELKNKQLGAEQSIKLLLGKEADNVHVRKYCERAERSLADMKELINSTVHAADIESALLAERFNSIAVRRFLKKYCDDLTDQNVSRVVLALDLTDECTIYGDALRLAQMLDKIVFNANDFREKDSDIIIGAGFDPQMNKVYLWVDNTGPTLPGDGSHLFDLSVSARDDAHRRKENVGFGLFVAKRIAEYHDGWIQATNTVDGVRFCVVLPATAGCS